MIIDNSENYQIMSLLDHVMYVYVQHSIDSAQINENKYCQTIRLLVNYQSALRIIPLLLYILSFQNVITLTTCLIPHSLLPSSLSQVLLLTVHLVSVGIVAKIQQYFIFLNTLSLFNSISFHRRNTEETSTRALFSSKSHDQNFLTEPKQKWHSQMQNYLLRND